MTGENPAWNRLVEAISMDVGQIGRLPESYEIMARMAVEGADVHQIAQTLQVSEDAVWSFVQDLADKATGRPAGGTARGFETGGLGSDTDPGVTGGYGDTALGSLDAAPSWPASPWPGHEEPEESAD